MSCHRWVTSVATAQWTGRYPTRAHSPFLSRSSAELMVREAVHHMICRPVQMHLTKHPQLAKHGDAHLPHKPFPRDVEVLGNKARRAASPDSGVAVAMTFCKLLAVGAVRGGPTHRRQRKTGRLHGTDLGGWYGVPYDLQGDHQKTHYVRLSRRQRHDDFRSWSPRPQGYFANIADLARGDVGERCHQTLWPEIRPVLGLGSESNQALSA